MVAPCRVFVDVLAQPQRAGTGDGFGAALDLEFAEDPAIVALTVSRARTRRSGHGHTFIDKESDQSTRLRQR